MRIALWYPTTAALAFAASHGSSGQAKLPFALASACSGGRVSVWNAASGYEALRLANDLVS